MNWGADALIVSVSFSLTQIITNASRLSIVRKRMNAGSTKLKYKAESDDMEHNLLCNVFL